MRRLHVVVAFLILTAQVAFAQRPAIPMPRPLPMPSGHSTPAPGARVRTTLVFGDGRVPPNVLLRRVNRHTAVFALPFFWSWGAPAFYVDTPVPLVGAGDVPIGGVQLDVTPWRSQVYVDGVLMGRVDAFSGYFHPLEIAAGPHQIAIVDTGYQPMVFEVMVTPGRTTTYRGVLAQ